MHCRLLFFSFFFPILFCYNSDAYKSFTEYLESYSYPFEEHFISTPDGYILRVFRIQKKAQPKIQRNFSGKVLLLMHGLADSSDTFIINKEEWAPALYLANQGHDVWLGNVRGNKHSRNHTILDPDKDKQFWDFTLDEMIKYDLPEILSLIHRQTQKKITYIGHSQGCTLIFAALAEKNQIVMETVEKILAFGPVIFLQHAKKRKPLKSFANNGVIEALASYFREAGGEVFIPDSLKNSIVNAICPSFKSVCDAGFETILEFLVNIDPKVDYMKRSEVFMTHYPGGTSIKSVIHWYQNLQSEEAVFRMFDYGAEKNMRKYSKEIPDFYDFKKIPHNVKIFLYIGHFDRVGTKSDILNFKQKIEGNNVFHRIYPLGHSSFVWGKELTYFLEDVNADINDCSCSN